MLFRSGLSGPLNSLAVLHLGIGGAETCGQFGQAEVFIVRSKLRHFRFGMRVAAVGAFEQSFVGGGGIVGCGVEIRVHFIDLRFVGCV